jgi:hypothetical protein
MCRIYPCSLDLLVLTCSLLDVLRIGTVGGLLWMRWWTFGSWRHGVSWLVYLTCKWTLFLLMHTKSKNILEISLYSYSKAYIIVHMGDLRVGRRLTLKRIVNHRMPVRMCARSIWVGTQTSGEVMWMRQWTLRFCEGRRNFLTLWEMIIACETTAP